MQGSTFRYPHVVLCQHSCCSSRQLVVITCDVEELCYCNHLYSRRSSRFFPLFLIYWVRQQNGNSTVHFITGEKSEASRYKLKFNWMPIMLIQIVIVVCCYYTDKISKWHISLFKIVTETNSNSITVCHQFHHAAFRKLLFYMYFW